MQVIDRAEQIESAAIRALFVYWSGKRRNGALPRRADVDPAEIPKLVPNIIIADIEYDPFRVRYRLAGTRIVAMTGYEFTGRYLDEIALPNDEGPFLECYRLACDSRAPVITRIKWRLGPNDAAEYDVCFLPLSDDGSTVDKVLAYECYANVERDYSLIASRRGAPAANKKRR